MSESSDDKKFKPSSKKLENLKKEGSFLRAKEFYSGIGLISSFVILYFMKGYFYSNITHNFLDVFSSISHISSENFLSKKLLVNLIINNILLIFLIFSFTSCVYILSVSLFGGLSFTTKLLFFKVERLSPKKNLARIFSSQNVMEILKSLLKLMLFMSALILFFYTHAEDILRLSNLSDINGMNHSMELLVDYFICIILIIALISTIDALVNHYFYHKKAMMTHQEMKDENKENEGSPEMKQKIRQVQQALSLQRLRQDVPRASIVITNPSHYAVALRYIEKVDAAPVIVAKGMDHMAFRIRELAAKHNIPIHPFPELTRAIYHTGKVGEQIDPELYMAVAIVLSYLLQLKEYQLGWGQKPPPIEDLKIPEHFKGY